MAVSSLTNNIFKNIMLPNKIKLDYETDKHVYIYVCVCVCVCDK